MSCYHAFSAATSGVRPAAYTASDNRAALTPRGGLAVLKPEDLIVNGSLVTDTLGREIVGTDNGKAGSDYIATINGTRVTTGGPPLVQAQRRPAAVADAIDHLLARGELNGLRDARHAGSEQRASNVGK
jgi:hypothetical protein